MNYNVNMMYAEDTGSNGKFIDYAKISRLIDDNEKRVAAIIAAANERIPVTSIEGTVHGPVENKINEITNSFEEIANYMKHVGKMLVDLKAAYQTTEQSVVAQINEINFTA